MFLNVFFLKKIYLEKTKKTSSVYWQVEWIYDIVLAVAPLHCPAANDAARMKSVKVLYFLLLLDSVKLNKLLMVFCKTVSFFGRWGFAKRLYLEWFFFFYSPALSDKRWKKVEKKEKRRLTKRTVLWYILFRLQRTETARFKRIGLWNKREGKEEKAKEQNLW